MFTGKTVIVAGGCGLIGTEIVDQFLILNAEVKSLDSNPKADLQVDLVDGEYLKLFDIPDIFVNAAYPKRHVKHFGIFLDASVIIASRMANRGHGVIVNLASIYGVIGGKPDMYTDTDVKYPPIGYSAAKGAIIALTRALACKYGRYGVRVNCVSPGGVYDGQDEVFVDRYCERVPLGTMATAEDVANAVIFLSSDKAGYITGCNLLVDGGITIQ